MVNFLSTSKSKLTNSENLNGYYWNPSKGEIDLNAFKGVSVIINLAGAPIAKKWSESYKKQILESRVNSLELLLNTIRNGKYKIEHLITASAIGIYPPSELELYEEKHLPESEDFVVQVVRQWEEAAHPFEDLNIPVTYLRIGLVLSEQGGVLEKLIGPIKAFVGSGLGSGKQWQSWIHIDDLIGIFMHCLNGKISGAFNAVAPNAVTHNVFVKSVAKALGRPIVLPNVPAWALRMTLGEMADIIVKGQRVSSKKIESSGYHFKFHQLDPALEDLLAS